MTQMFLRTFLLLCAAHALCDYPLQGETLSRGKSGLIPGCPWWLALSAHSVIHAGAVLLITNSLWLATAELIAHFAIDTLKARAFVIGFKVDQALHLLCKVAWALEVMRLTA